MKKVISLILATLFCLFTLNFSAMAANGRTGISLAREAIKGVSHPVGYYITNKKLEKIPATFEAWVYIPKADYAKRSIILGNSLGYVEDDTFSFEINANGIPRLLLYDTSGTAHDYQFTKATVPADKWCHVAIVYGMGFDNEQISCYVDGVLKETTEIGVWFKMNPSVLDNTVCLAGDHSCLNEQAFRGTLGDVVVYSDVRTAEEIAKDAKNAPDVNDKDLLIYYNLSSATSGADVQDASKNGYDMKYYKTWLTEEEMQAVRDADNFNYTYTIAFLPDPQYSTRLYPKRLPNAFDYLLKNVEKKNIKYLIGLGDMTDQNGDIEWKTIKAQYDRLDGKLPYSLVRGNHDITKNGNARLYEKYYGKDSYYYNHVKENGGFYNEANSINTYLLFDVGNVKYIILNLDFGLDDNAIAWANKVLSEHSDRRAILATHGYLNSNGEVLRGNEYASPSTYLQHLNDGDDMWEKLVSKHENIDMIVAGHMSADDIIYTKAVGDAGNEVYQILMDPQKTDNRLGGAGIVGLMYFTENGNHARVEYYSTMFKKYFRGANNDIALSFGPVEDCELKTVETAPVTSESEEALTTPPVTMDPVPTQGTAAVPQDTNSGTEPTADSGCGGAVSFVSLAIVSALGTCVAFVAKKKED